MNENECMFFRSKGELMQRITPEKTAEILEVSTRTLANWRSDGGGPAFYKKGRIVFYDLQEVEDFERQRVRRVEL